MDDLNCMVHQQYFKEAGGAVVVALHDLLCQMHSSISSDPTTRVLPTNFEKIIGRDPCMASFLRGDELNPVASLCTLLGRLHHATKDSNDHSSISATFGHAIQTKHTCNRCQRVRLTQEGLGYCIPLSRKSAGGQAFDDLESSLYQFFRLEPINAWCKGCSCKTETSRHRSLVSPPRILVLSLSESADMLQLSLIISGF